MFRWLDFHGSSLPSACNIQARALPSMHGGQAAGRGSRGLDYSTAKRDLLVGVGSILAHFVIVLGVLNKINLQNYFHNLCANSRVKSNKVFDFVIRG
jgi:hypothetical protein